MSLALQIAAQELSDNRVITLSLAGRRLDKKVRRAEEGLQRGTVNLHQPQGCVASLRAPGHHLHHIPGTHPAQGPPGHSRLGPLHL